MCNEPGYDMVAQAAGGLMSLTGELGGTPMKAGNAMATSASYPATPSVLDDSSSRTYLRHRYTEFRCRRAPVVE